MNSLNEIMELLNEHMDSIQNFHVSKIGVFGSFVREEQTIHSDVDILVEFEENQETFDHYMDLKFYLEDLFDRKVDVVIANDIKENMKKYILESVEYAKGF